MKEIFDEVDEDGNGTIEFEEFLRVIKAGSKKKREKEVVEKGTKILP